ncbi:MAG: IPTL-CTERM sorting domain-containing protein [Proteobacteria bacterium]|nr:IPTL-CTERM sorting domain-containing protein [Pseudomonadota bacterium]
MGDSEECTIINTAFFEGIPTLNQYGLAIMALLMLGVGFVGFRRFV